MKANDFITIREPQQKEGNFKKPEKRGKHNKGLGEEEQALKHLFKRIPKEEKDLLNFIRLHIRGELRTQLLALEAKFEKETPETVEDLGCLFDHLQLKEKGKKKPKVIEIKKEQKEEKGIQKEKAKDYEDVYVYVRSENGKGMYHTKRDCSKARVTIQLTQKVITERAPCGRCGAMGLVNVGIIPQEKVKTVSQKKDV